MVPSCYTLIRIKIKINIAAISHSCLFSGEPTNWGLKAEVESRRAAKEKEINVAHFTSTYQLGKFSSNYCMHYWTVIIKCIRCNTVLIIHIHLSC